MPSAPAASASRAQKTALAVWLPPAPAMTGTRPPLTVRTTAAVTALRSSPESVADSPVVPHGTRKSIPAPICHSTSRSSAPKSIRPRSSNGVTSAVPHPFQSTLVSPNPSLSLLFGLRQKLPELRRPSAGDSLRGPDGAPREPGPAARPVDDLDLVFRGFEHEPVRAGNRAGADARDGKPPPRLPLDDRRDRSRAVPEGASRFSRVVLLDEVGRVSRPRVEPRRARGQVEEVTDADGEVRGVDERAAPPSEGLG